MDRRCEHTSQQVKALWEWRAKRKEWEDSQYWWRKLTNNQYPIELQKEPDVEHVDFYGLAHVCPFEPRWIPSVIKMRKREEWDFCFIPLHFPSSSSSFAS